MVGGRIVVSELGFKAGRRVKLDAFMQQLRSWAYRRLIEDDASKILAGVTCNSVGLKHALG